MLQSLLIAPAWVKAGNSSPRLLHNLRQFLYSLHRSRKKCILNWLNQYRVKTTFFDQNTVKRLNEIELSNTFDGQKKNLKRSGKFTVSWILIIYCTWKWVQRSYKSNKNEILKYHL